MTIINDLINEIISRTDNSDDEFQQKMNEFLQSKFLYLIFLFFFSRYVKIKI